MVLELDVTVDDNQCIISALIRAYTWSISQNFTNKKAVNIILRTFAVIVYLVNISHPFALFLSLGISHIKGSVSTIHIEWIYKWSIQCKLICIYDGKLVPWYENEWFRIDACTWKAYIWPSFILPTNLSTGYKFRHLWCKSI